MKSRVLSLLALGVLSLVSPALATLPSTGIPSDCRVGTITVSTARGYTYEQHNLGHRVGASRDYFAEPGVFPPPDVTLSLSCDYEERGFDQLLRESASVGLEWHPLEKLLYSPAMPCPGWRTPLSPLETNGPFSLTKSADGSSGNMYHMLLMAVIVRSTEDWFSHY